MTATVFPAVPAVVLTAAAVGGPGARSWVGLGLWTTRALPTALD